MADRVALGVDWVEIPGPQVVLDENGVYHDARTVEPREGF